jgi:hypothetical protein
MRRDTDHRRARLAQPPVEFECEEQVGEFALRIARATAIAALELEILPVHLARAMRRTAHGDDARSGRVEEARQQQTGQREVAEMVGPELHLETVRGMAPWDRHHAGVVAEQVEPLMFRDERCREGADRRERREVERHRFGGTTDSPRESPAAQMAFVASRQRAPLRPSGELSAVAAEPAVGARDDRDASL